MYQNPPQYYQPQPQQLTPQQLAQQKLAYAIQKIHEIRSDLTTGFNQYRLRDSLDQTLQIVEYLLTGQVSHANPNQVPGLPLDPLDQGKAKVEYFGTHANPAPRSPVNNGGDVNFIPGPPSGVGAVGGQTVEYYAAPPGTVLPNGQQVTNVTEQNGMRVEFFAQPQPQGAQQPSSGSTVNNPPTTSFAPGRPPLTVEAGNPIPRLNPEPMPMSVPGANPFSLVANPFSNEVAHAPAPKAPATREELLAALPIPLT